MVLEFLNSFDEVFSASESLPMPITFGKIRHFVSVESTV